MFSSLLQASPRSERLEQATCSVSEDCHLPRQLRIWHRGQRETRVTGNEAQRTVGRKKKKGEVSGYETVAKN